MTKRHEYVRNLKLYLSKTLSPLSAIYISDEIFAMIILCGKRKLKDF